MAGDISFGRPRIGRAPATTHADLSHIALQLFLDRGFDATTIDDIVSAAGIGRRTFFRYYPSKNDLPWGEFDALLHSMRVYLSSLPSDLPLAEALRRAVVEFNRFPAVEVPFHRARMRLLLGVPTLVAHSTLRYEAWRGVIAEFAAERLGEPVDGLRARSIAWTCLSLCLAAYEQWLVHEDADLLDLLDASFGMVSDLFSEGGA